MLSHDGARPRRSLIAVFVAWKALLLLVAVGSAIGPAYDTSTTLLLSQQAPASDESALDLGTRLTRWDAIYFIENARRGYLFEQEWAFGAGLPTLIAAVVQGESRAPAPVTPPRLAAPLDDGLRFSLSSLQALRGSAWRTMALWSPGSELSLPTYRTSCPCWPCTSWA